MHLAGTVLTSNSVKSNGVEVGPLNFRWLIKYLEK